jgi:hypothetical protein
MLGFAPEGDGAAALHLAALLARSACNRVWWPPS